MERVDVAFVVTEVRSSTSYPTIGVCFKGEVLSFGQEEILLEHLKHEFQDQSLVAVLVFNNSSMAWVEISQRLTKGDLAKKARQFAKILKRLNLAKSVELYRLEPRHRCR